MSGSIYVVAQKQLTKEDFDKVVLYNGLFEEGYDIPQELKKDLLNILGPDVLDDGLISVPEEGQIVELYLEGDGDVMYGDGLLIPISVLPINTVALRVYAEA